MPFVAVAVLRLGEKPLPSLSKTPEVEFSEGRKKKSGDFEFSFCFGRFFATVYCLLAVSHPMNSPSLSCVSGLP